MTLGSATGDRYRGLPQLGLRRDVHSHRRLSFEAVPLLSHDPTSFVVKAFNASVGEVPPDHVRGRVLDLGEPREVVGTRVASWRFIERGQYDKRCERPASVGTYFVAGSPDRSTTAAPGALFCTDSMPFFALALDS
jgi:hypothetical protein